MIVMRGVDHRFVFQRGVRSGQHGNHIVRRKRTNLADHLRLQPHRQGPGMKIAGTGVRHHLVEVEPRHRGQLFRDIQLHPGSHSQLGRVLDLEIGLLPRIRVPHHLPRIAGHIGLVNQHHAHRAFARCLFILVGPAPIVGQRPAREELRVIRRWLIHQHQQHFTAHVDALVIVPVIFRRVDPVTHIDDRCIDRRRGLLRLVVAHILIEQLQIERRALLRLERERRLRQCGHSDQGDFLHVGSVVARRLQPIEGELCAHVLGRNVASALSGTAAFEQVMRQKSHVRPNAFRIDLLHGGKGKTGEPHRNDRRPHRFRRRRPANESRENRQKQNQTFAHPMRLLRAESNQEEPLIVWEPENS